MTVVLNAGAVAVRNSHYSAASGPLFLDSVACNGSESNLLACRAQRWPTLCSHDNEAGVTCEGQMIKIKSFCSLFVSMYLTLYTLHLNFTSGTWEPH